MKRFSAQETIELRTRPRPVRRACELELKGARRRVTEDGEAGWALLGVLLALAVLSIVMVSSVVPNVRVQVQRTKEAEMLYRGERMARGIARYYAMREKEGPGEIPNLQLLVRPQYGYLTELNKLRDGVRLNTRELKFVRPSTMIDPMISLEWEPVRARDPRIMKFLHAFAAESQIPIPESLWLIAGPPQPLRTKPGEGSETDEEAPQPPVVTPPPRNPGPPAGNPDGDDDDGDDDDDDDDEDGDPLTPNDPLKHLFEGSSPGSSNAPIVAVAPRVKGKAVRPLYGLENYEDWIFIYIFVPPPTLVRPPAGPPGGVPREPRGGSVKP